MTKRRIPFVGLTATDLILFVAYVALLVLTVRFHEPWADEAQAWLLARDSSVLGLLFHNLRYEGHPGLWYLLLWVPTHLGLPYRFYGWIAAAIAVAGIYVFLRFVPFPLYLRALIPFTFFLAYEYALIARSYVLFPLLGFWVAHLYRACRPRPFAMAMALSLLANVSVHGTIVALCFAAAYFAKLYRLRRLASGSIEYRGIGAAAAIFGASIMLVLVCLWPAQDSLPRLSPGWNRVISRLAVPSNKDSPRTASDPADAQPPAQAVRAPAASPSKAPVHGHLAAAYEYLILPFGHWPVLVFAFELSVLFMLWRERQLILATPLVMLFLFLVLVYGATWHIGLLWIVCIMVLWAAWDSSLPPKRLRVQNVTGVLFGALCLSQLPWTVHAFAYDAANATSPDKAVAEYLHTLPSGYRIAGIGMAPGVQPYFDHNIFINHRLSYTQWQTNTVDASMDRVLAMHPDAIVGEPTVRSSLPEAQYKETRTFCGALYFPNLPPAPGCLSIFERVR